MELPPRFAARNAQELALDGFAALPFHAAHDLVKSTLVEETVLTCISVILASIFHGGTDFNAGSMSAETNLRGTSTVAPDTGKERPVTTGLEGKSVLSDHAITVLKAEYSACVDAVVVAFLAVGYALVKRRSSKKFPAYDVPWIVPLSRYQLMRRFNTETGYEYTATWMGADDETNNTEVSDAILLMSSEPDEWFGAPTSRVSQIDTSARLLTKLNMDYNTATHNMVRPPMPISIDPGARTGAPSGQPPTLGLSEMATSSMGMVDEINTARNHSVGKKTRKSAIDHLHEQRQHSFDSARSVAANAIVTGVEGREAIASRIGMMYEQEASYNRIIPLLSGEKLSTAPSPIIPGDIQLQMLTLQKKISMVMGVSPTYLQLQPNQFAANAEVSLNFQNNAMKRYANEFAPLLARMFEFVNKEFLSLGKQVEVELQVDSDDDYDDDEDWEIGRHSKKKRIVSARKPKKNKVISKYWQPTGPSIPIDCQLHCASVTSISDIHQVFSMGALEHKDAARHAVAALGLDTSLAISDNRYSLEDFRPSSSQQDQNKSEKRDSSRSKPGK